MLPDSVATSRRAGKPGALPTDGSLRRDAGDDTEPGAPCLNPPHRDLAPGPSPSVPRPRRRPAALPDSLAHD